MRVRWLTLAFLGISCRTPPNQLGAREDLGGVDLSSTDRLRFDLAAVDLASRDFAAVDLASRDFAAVDLASRDFAAVDLAGRDFATVDLAPRDLAPGPRCGDGIVQPGEACDLGASNRDRPAFFVSQPSGLGTSTDPLARARTAVSFYDYRSSSSHTGLEVAGESRAYLYVDRTTGRLSLILNHGIDDDTGQVQPPSRVEMDLAGLPSTWSIDLTDDAASEFYGTGASSAAGRWSFSRNTDGGVVGGLPFPGAWKVTVTPRFRSGISSWEWVRDDGTRLALAMDQTLTIESFDTPSACRSDCTIPRCGDGLLDGGEVCDDGGAGACTPDCSGYR
jgi:hypothetical protein